MEKLADFLSVEPIFKNTGITKNWLHCLANGYTKIYTSSEILNYYHEKDICFINSGSIDDEKFSKSILKDIKKLVTENDKVIISSSVHSISSFMQKLGFIHFPQQNVYIKGVSKWE